MIAAIIQAAVAAASGVFTSISMKLVMVAGKATMIPTIITTKLAAAKAAVATTAQATAVAATTAAPTAAPTAALPSAAVTLPSGTVMAPQVASVAPATTAAPTLNTATIQMAPPAEGLANPTQAVELAQAAAAGKTSAVGKIGQMAAKHAMGEKQLLQQNINEDNSNLGDQIVDFFMGNSKAA